jgi:hypothetical protein
MIDKSLVFKFRWNIFGQTEILTSKVHSSFWHKILYEIISECFSPFIIHSENHGCRTHWKLKLKWSSGQRKWCYKFTSTVAQNFFDSCCPTERLVVLSFRGKQNKSKRQRLGMDRKFALLGKYLIFPFLISIIQGL